MRVLVTTNAAVGHFFPLAPTASALVAAGHDVRVGCPARFATTVEQAGFAVLACDERPPGAEPPEAPPVEEHEARLRWSMTLGWPHDARAWTDSLLGRLRGWRPDVVVVEPLEHAGRIAAAVTGAPLVEHGWGFTPPAGMLELATDSLRDLYERLGAVPPAPALAVDLGTASLQAPDATALPRYRFVPWSQPGEPLPEPGAAPRVLVTLGTYDNPRAASAIRAAAAAAARCDAEVVVALGNPDRGSGDFPPGATVRRWLDVPAAVSTARLVVHHGGAGVSWSTLAAGKPAVVVPQQADQFRNASLLERAGVAAVAGADDGALLEAAIATALAERSCAERARLVAAENAALPGPDELARAIAETALRPDRRCSSR